MTGIGKVCPKTVKRSDKAIVCDHCDNWTHIKHNNLDKFDYESLKVQQTHGHKEAIITPTNLFHHNEAFQLIKPFVHYFLSNFYISSNDSPSKTMFFISSKKLFLFSRYSIFCISIFPSFSPCQPLL